MSQELVLEVKAYLQSIGEDLDGPCGAFKITRRVAGLLRAGYLSKPNGNNCEGYAVDQVCFSDGLIRDVLGDAGGANTPQWGGLEEVDKDRFVKAELWDFPTGTPDPPLPDPEPDPVDLTPILARLDAIEAKQVEQASLVSRIIDEFGTGVREVLSKMVVRGNTSRVGFHAHQVNLKIEEV